MTKTLVQQVVNILSNSENRELRTSQVIHQLNNFDPASNDHKIALANAIDILTDKGLLRIDNPPAYAKSLDGLVSYYDKVLTLNESESGKAKN